MAFKQRKFRSKTTAEEEDGEEDGPPAIRPPQQVKKEVAKPSAAAPGAAVKVEAKKGDARGAKLSLLSFEEDTGEDAGFVTKKEKKAEKQRAKLARAPALPELPMDLAQQTQRSTAGEYTADRLKELQRNAISFSTAKLSGPAEGAGAGGSGAEPVIKLSGSFKRAGAPKDDRFTMKEGPNALVQQEGQESMPLPPPPRPGAGAGPADGKAAGAPRPGAEGGAGPTDAAAADDEDDDMGIPDEQTILAVKAKRERLRQAHLAPDYIPTSSIAGLSGRRWGGAGREGSAGPGGSGEAGGSGSDSEAEAEDLMRIKFSGKEPSRASRRQGAQPAAGAGPGPAAAGGEDEDEAFAEEQLRKALRLQQLGGAGTAAIPPPPAAGPGPGSAASAAAAAAGGFAPPPYPSNHMRGPSGYTYGAGAGGPGLGGPGGGGSRMAAISAAGDAVVASLAEGLKRMQASHKQVAQNAKRTADNLTGSLAKVEALEAELKSAGDKYLYVQQLRAYVADLCDCLQVKSAIVEELEDTRLELMEDRAKAARTAAANAERDLLAPAEAAVAAAMGSLGRGGGGPAASQAADAAARDAEDRLLDEEGPVELDEFGRNVNLQKRRELEERAVGRKRLLAMEGERLAKAVAGAPVQPLVTEGEPEDEQASRYTLRYKEIVEAADTAFADAGEEYASIAAVKQRLEDWKAKYPKDYTNAYMHLSTPALFAPYVRLELLHWDPLYGATAEAPYQGFDTQAWYGDLFEYGMAGAGGEVLMADDDPDSELVPALVRKLVLPLALHWIERCWDARNVGQTRAVAALASELLVYVPAEEQRMVELLSVLRRSLEEAAEAASLPPWPPAILAVCPLAARVLFHRFRLALRLLHCVSAFEGLLARGLLAGLALGRLVCGSMMTYLRTTSLGGEAGLPFAVSAAEAVAEALHPDWFAAGPLPEAAAFLEHCAALARVVEANRGAPGRAELAARLAQVLTRLGDKERGARLAAAFGVRS
ncbi:hypothetical protein HYH03_000598 [Edaphochlamys debaryana]|uniref:GCF C-terminal domain-containing protein n=1 Tax=Edaphochlamys debaryana TaxID=47281 RepID=A0A836C6C3_9CHLO|nr:hypothetical protein HYH03_000598 [Edaphochlamys debaryana]|eukprot:KAG2502106.1 hypothetical protein HYH03_000598 [Edaphochlamys debaryana]